MSRRIPLAPSALALAAFFAGGCGNISLNAGDFANANVPAPAPIPRAGDGGPAASDGSPAMGESGADAGVSVPAFDAGAPGAQVGNPLCFVSFAAGGQHVCSPDTSAMCSAGTADYDAGAYNAWDASDADGGPPTACHVTGGATQRCEAAGPGGDGAQCQVSADCASMFECVGAPGRCRHYCCSGNSSCAQAQDAGTVASQTFCDIAPVAAGVAPSPFDVPVCVPFTGCILLANGSPAGSCTDPGTTCAVVQDDGTPGCVDVGPGGVGAECDAQHCAAGLTCLGLIGSRTCFQLCQVDEPGSCPGGTACTGSAQLFSTANIGICQ